MTYCEDDWLPLSGLQHLVFCERQWALIHVERIWSENRLTAEGRLLHKQPDSDRVENRHDLRIVRGMRIWSAELGLVGRADVVELREGDALLKDDGQVITPVEYKRGRPKGHDADLVQLCAQALCLEAMYLARIDRGCLFYGRTRRRMEVRFTPALRTRTSHLAHRMHELFATGTTPVGRNDRACKQCSLVDVCMPQVSCGASSADYLRGMIDSEIGPD